LFVEIFLLEYEPMNDLTIPLVSVDFSGLICGWLG